MRRPAADPLAGAADLATPGAWLAFATALLEKAGVALGQVATDAHDEALYLILRTLGLPLESGPAVLRRSLKPEERARLEAVFRRRAVDRVPAAYLTREAWLGPHRFLVDERVIIPRSYFLELIPGALAACLPRGTRVRRAVDVCTGSGCLAILLAHGFPEAQVDACDLSADALDVARVNVREHHLADRVGLFRSDVFDAVPPAAYDLIISNPPYEPSAHVDTQAPEFAAEPRMAHDGGRDGLVIIRKLIHQAANRLAPHGLLAIEVGGLHAAINREFAALRPEWLPTQDGSDCVVVFRAASLTAAGTVTGPRPNASAASRPSTSRSPQAPRSRRAR
ncbi:MAG: 50S ribosomal protein L3 N(5)-glutamine methyltransferase [Opitutaceae bacterium]|jgi:ribosomal protein L3 glutamine methyltransferase|nr:50S ribosomal protein L3 N(5)-glutamine methyltransferase [Opitutaceae bacterium]